MFNPQAYAEVATNNYVQLNFGKFQYRININLKGFRYTFADYYYVQDLDATNQRCQGMESNTKAFYLEITTESYVEECSYGLFGRITDNLEELCRSHRYIPKEAVMTRKFSEKYDTIKEVLPYTCNY